MSEIEDKLVAILTQIENAYAQDHLVIFGSDVERRRQFFDYWQKSRKTWQKPVECMYRGCGRPSISRSHTLHRSGPLKTIAENGHVLTPTYQESGEVKMEKIGIGLASTFAGFCSDHEDLFSEFESTGKIAEQRHFALQAFRSTCREIALKRHEVQIHEHLINKLQKQRAEFFTSEFRSKLPHSNVQKVDIQSDPAELYLSEQLLSLEHTLALLEEIYDELFDYIDLMAGDPSMICGIVPVAMPICLSGIGVINYQAANEVAPAVCITSVIPQGRRTAISITTARRHSKLIKPYEMTIGKGLTCLDAIESWMINGTDHWFIKPSEWAAIPPHRKAAVEHAVPRPGENILSGTHLSVLDNLRRKFLRRAEEEIAQLIQPDPEIIAYLMQQNSKLG